MKLFIKKTQLIATLFFLGLFTTYANNFDDVSLKSNNDLQAINASVLHPTSGKIHFFVGQFFHQYNPTTDKLEKMGKIGKEGWYGLSPNVNAALINPQNKKAYFFTGNMYQIYDFSKKKAGAKRVIGQDGWTGVEGPIDAAIMHPTNNCAYFFKGKKYQRFSFSKNKVDKTGTIGVDGWKGLPANIDSATMHPNGKAYFFAGDRYYRYVFGLRVDKSGIIGRDGWKGLFHKIDAVVENKDDSHFIKDGLVMSLKSYKERKYLNSQINKKWSLFLEYATYPLVDKFKLGYDSYKGVPKNIDAAIKHPKNKKYYFFKDKKYYRYDTSKQVVDKVGIIGSDGWKNLPQNLNAATASKHKIYFFKGTKYFIHSITKGKIVESGEIASKFKGIPNYIDAAYTFQNHSGARFLLFIKKDVTYIFSESKRQLVNYKLLNQSLFE